MSPEAFLARLSGVRRNGGGWQALCPAHPDRNPSLSIAVGNGRILVHCHAGCSQEAVLAALGIELSELFSDNGVAPRILAEYDYRNENDELLFQVVRYEPKGFRQRRPDGKGGYIWNLNGVARVLYGLPDVLKAKSVLVVEGEKDVATGNALGLTATCNAGGAGKWRDDYSESLRGKRIVVIADGDEPGRKHAAQVAASLAGKVESLKVLELRGSKDLSDWVERGGTREALINLIQATLEWNPQSSIDADAMLKDVFNFIRRFVSLSPSQARVVSLWVLHTHVIDAADATPYLAITSAEKQSGKTRLLEV
ncbi:MAG: hypothetical protein WCB00_06795, partial [Candidatus Acidiferrales bacterium]